MRLSGETVRISSGEYAWRDHAFGIAGRDRRESRPQLAHVPLVLVDAPAGRVRAARSRTAGTPSAARARSARPRTRSRPGGRRRSPISHGASSPVSHVSSTRGSRRARQRVCIDSAPPMSATSSSLRWMRVGHLVDEQLRAVAADGRHHGRRGARCRAGARAARPDRDTATIRSARSPPRRPDRAASRRDVASASARRHASARRSIGARARRPPRRAVRPARRRRRPVSEDRPSGERYPGVGLVGS